MADQNNIVLVHPIPIGSQGRAEGEATVLPPPLSAAAAPDFQARLSISSPDFHLWVNSTSERKKHVETRPTSDSDSVPIRWRAGGEVESVRGLILPPPSFYWEAVSGCDHVKKGVDYTGSKKKNGRLKGRRRDERGARCGTTTQWHIQGFNGRLLPLVKPAFLPVSNNIPLCTLSFNGMRLTLGRDLPSHDILSECWLLLCSCL